MASTNKTANYELSQFLGSDKPAWLSDYNTDMSKIDAQMKLNADGVTSASGSASSANTAIGTLANLTTDVKTDLVSSINEVDSHADSASQTAGSALSASTINADAITAINSYLNLNVNNTYTGSQFTVTSGSGTPSSSAEIFIARNSDGSLCKIYGTLPVTGSTVNSRTTCKLNLDTGLRPTENITVLNTGFISDANGLPSNLWITLNTDGTIELEGYHATTDYSYRCLACVIFVKNFGDTPQPE